MDENEKKKMEEAIETATEEIHRLFVHNGWKWGGLGSDPEHIPSKEEIKGCIEGLVAYILSEKGKDCDSIAEGLIEVEWGETNMIAINLVFQGGHFFL